MKGGEEKGTIIGLARRHTAEGESAGFREDAGGRERGTERKRG